MDFKPNSSHFESLGPVSQTENAILERLSIDKKLYVKKTAYYNEHKKTIWIGKVIDYIPEGHGIFILSNPKKIVIVVETKSGQKDGLGKVYFEDGSHYQVMFRKDECDGVSDFYSNAKKKLMTATFKLENQVEIHYHATGEYYVGEHYYLMRNGRGKQFRDKSQTMECIIFNGQWVYDKFLKGHGKVEYYEGDLDNDIYQGQGVQFHDRQNKRKKYKGQFVNGKPHGAAQEFFDNQTNDLKYEGNFTYGIYDGDGALTELEPEKRTYVGKFKMGIMNMEIDILDQYDRNWKRLLYKDGEVIETIEEYFYNIRLPNLDEVHETEVKNGYIDIQTVEKVCYNNPMQSLRYYARIKDKQPTYMMQVDPKTFLIKYDGVLNCGGQLVYSGDMRHMLFHGKGTLRYKMKNEPRKYIGSFADGLFNGNGDLYDSNGKLIYTGQFKDNMFDGKGILSIRNIPMMGNQNIPEKNLKAGKFTIVTFDVEVDGIFVQGKFQGGIWRYTGSSDTNLGKVYQIKVSKKSDKLEGKMFDRDTIIFEGVFENYTFSEYGTLYYSDGENKKYEGYFKDGQFHGQGSLYDSQGKIIYKGNFNEGAFNEKGKLYQCINEGLVFEGDFKEGQIMGEGKMLEQDGKLRSEGTYENGNLIQGYILIYDKSTRKLKYEGYIKKGKYQGEGTLYTQKGEIMQKGHFENGELINGLRRDFFHDGTLEKEGNVKNAKYEGPVKEYYFDGKLLFEGEYANGDKNGKGVIYHKNGKQKQWGLFKDNVFFDGEALYYHEDNLTVKYEGRVRSMYYNGWGKKYYDNGFLEYEGDFKNGLFEGEGTYYHAEERNRIKFKGSFANGSPAGGGELLDTKGRVVYRGQLVNWKKHGEGVLFSETGEKLLEGRFEDDEIFKGVGKLYWPGFGTLKYEGDFDNGYQEGVGKSYYTNGNLEWDGTFKANHPDGEGVLYDENNKGQKVYVGSMQRGRPHGSGILYGPDEVYEGEFKGGKRSGMGILKYTNPQWGVKFEGRFQTDDMEEGTAKLRDADGKMIYDGQIKKGSYYGEGIKYNDKGKIEYTGHWKDGLYEGSGTCYHDDGTKKYDGEFSKGQYHGEGKLYFEGGKINYSGGFYKGKFHGQGELYDDKGFITYRGSFKENQFTGKGTFYLPGTKKLKYEGELIKGQYEGVGTKYSKKGYKKYTGTFKNGKFDGEGTLFWPDGKTKKYQGMIQQKKYYGKGILYTQSGGVLYEGEFDNGQYHGKGVLHNSTNPDKLQYRGDFVKGKPDGVGELYFENGVVQFKGEVKDGQPNGKGVLYYEDGKVKCEGSFVNGNLQK